MDNSQILIQKQWLLRLIQLNDELQKENEKRKDPVETMNKLNYLMGYIDSAKDLPTLY